VFTNLHFIHHYYPYANGIFLIATFGWAIVALLEDGGKRRYFGIALLLLCLAASVRHYRSYSWRFSEDVAFGPFRPELLQAIQSYTRSSDVLIAFGTDWSSELPYYSERRALMWKDENPDLNSPRLQTAISRLATIDQSKHCLFGASKVAEDILVQEYGRYFGMPTCLRGGLSDRAEPLRSGVLHGFLSYLIKVQSLRLQGKQVRDNIYSFDVARLQTDSSSLKHSSGWKN
jgi:hypothetical protein